MKMLVQCQGVRGRVQEEVMVRELHEHKELLIATHHAPGRYDLWTVSDLTTGMAITSSISKKIALAKAKKLIDEHIKTYKARQTHSLVKIFNSSINGDFELLERIERKCVARGFSSTVKIEGIYADEIYIKK